MAVAGFAQAGVIFVARGVDNFIRTFENVNRTFEKFNRKVTASASSWNRLEAQLNRVGTITLVSLVAGLTAASIAIGALTIAGVSVAASFENAFADVTKTVDAFVDRAATARDGVIRLTEEGQKFRDELKALSFEVPVTFESLSAIAGLGGQLGIVEGLAGDEAREALLSFSATVAGLGEATNLTQQKAATGLAQISNIFRETVTDIGLNIEQLGATIVELGNTSAATESLILNFSQRIAGAGSTVGLTQAQVLGIGTAFASIGITAEAGATAVNRALLIINEAVSNSTDKFLDNTSAINTTIEEISDLQADLVRLEAQTGITGRSLTDQRDAFLELGGAAEEFGRQLGDARREQLFKTQTEVDRLTQKLNELRLTQGQALTTEVFDELLRVVQNTAKGAEVTAEAFRKMFREDPAEAFTLFVEGLALEGERAGETLDKIGLGSVEATRAFLAMSNASGLVRDRILAAVEAFEKNSALVDEISIRYATLRSNFIELINVIRGVTDTIFNPLIEPAIKLVEWGKEVVLVFGEQIPRVFEALAAKLGPELQEIMDSIFGPGLFAGAEVETPEGFTISGEAIGIEPAFVTSLKESFDNLVASIEALDVSGLSDKFIAFRDTIAPIWNSAVLFAKENADIFKGAIKGLIIVLGGAALFSAVSKAAAAIALIATPLGVLATTVIGLSIAWETNFLNIQQVTDRVVGSITGKLDDLATQVSGIEFLPFEFPESDVTPLERLTEVGELLLETFGNVVETAMSIGIDTLSGFFEFLDGVGLIVDGLTSENLRLATVLGGIQQAINGFVDAMITSPIRNIAALLGLEDIVGEDPLAAVKDYLFNAARDMIDGFLRGFGVEGIENLGESWSQLLDTLSQLGESPAIQSLIENWEPFSESLQRAFEAIDSLLGSFKELIGLKPDDSLFTFLGAIVGFTADTTLDALAGLVDTLTGLVVVIDGLINLDVEKMTTGLGMMGEGIANLALAIPTNIAERVGVDMEIVGSQAAEGFSRGWEEGVVVDTGEGSAIAEWIKGISDAITKGINDAIAEVQELAAINLDVEDFIDFKAIDASMGKMFDDWGLAVFGFFVNLDKSMGIMFDAWALAVFETFSGILSPIDLGIPSFDEIISAAKTAAEKIKAFFSGLFDDIGLTSLLETLGLIEVDVDTSRIGGEIEGVGDALAEGLINEVEGAEETWRDAFIDFLTAPIDLGKDVLGIESPSTVTQEMGEDVVEGYALGLSNLTPIEEALLGIHNTILTSFGNLSTQIMTVSVPALQEVERNFISLYSDTLPRTTSALVDELIPAKMELAEVNMEEVVPSVEELIEVEEDLADVFDDVIIRLDRLISLKRSAKDRSKDLREQIDLLAKSYAALAAAIESVNEAGVTPPGISPGPAGPEFQRGGSFVVPQTVGSEGMPIRVHAGELVQIVPAEFRERMQSIPIDVVPSSLQSPRITGAPINNFINNRQETNTSQTKEFHLHVTEAPTSDVRDSFELLETLS